MEHLTCLFLLMALCLFVAFIVWFAIVFLHDETYPDKYRAHEDLERYQELIHDNEYFYENPEMYDEYLKLQPYRNDWSVRNNKEKTQFELATKTRNPTDENKGSLTLSGNTNYKHTLNVSPMTI